MWKDYSSSYLRRNKASSISIIAAALLATLFLSLICSLFYNIWRDDISRIIREEGNWQSRISGDISEADAEVIRSFANVSEVSVYHDKNGRMTADIQFGNMRDAYRDLPGIAEQLGSSDTEISCHDTLLSEFLVFNPQDEQPPMLLLFFIAVILLAGSSLVLIIRNAFAVSMAARTHQFGILSSVGATPRQIRICLLQEAAVLCVVPALLGTVGGMAALAGESAAKTGSAAAKMGESAAKTGSADADISAQGNRCCLVKSQVVILDDAAFLDYCEQIGIEPQTGGGIVWNCIWDSLNSNFRYRNYIPFVRETVQNLMLTEETGGSTVAVLDVLACTEETPLLREEYEDYSLVQFIPTSLWEQISNQAEAEPDTNVRILTTDEDKIYDVEEQVKSLLNKTYQAEVENRIQEKLSNNEILKGYFIVTGVLCVLLAVIGIANVFSNTLGFLYQRKREFARYLSVGVTPTGLRKILWIEALTIAGRPVLITIPFTVAFVVFAVTASYLDPAEFIAVLPAAPIAVFLLFIVLSVGLAYYIGGRQLLRDDLSVVLRDDTMV